MISTEKIIINICTYKRPNMLTGCINSILSQQIPNEWNVELVIIDNDAQKSAEKTVKSLQETAQLPLHYYCEQHKGISFARNLGCKESINRKADWILFIDDDETAHENWIMAYFEATKKIKSEVYSGPVKYIFPKDYSDWLSNAGYSKTQDGNEKERASTNNALIHKYLISDSGYNLKFDIEMALTGGEDTDFFLRYRKMGGKIIYVHDAIVLEEVQKNRLTISWRLKRQFSSSTNRVYVNKKIMGTKKAVFSAIKYCLRHTFEGLLGLVFSPLSVFKGKNIFKRKYYHALRHLAKATGSFTGIFNMQPQPYKNPDGF